MGAAIDRRSLATALLCVLPLLVLVVPQGTIQRTLVPELLFVAALLLTVVTSLAQASWLQPPLALRRDQFQPMLLLALVYFLLLNPLWSLHQGNEPARVAMTALPFVMLGLYYPITLQRQNAGLAGRLVLMLAVSGVVLAAVVVGNYFLGDQASTAGRSTGIEGDRTLTLPLLPMAGVLSTAWALAAPKGLASRSWSVAALLIAIAIIMTVTRAMLAAYLIGTAVAAGILLWHGDSATRRRTGRRLLAGLFAVMALGAPLMAQWLDRLDPDSQGDVGTILGRLDEYTAFLDAFIASPLLGKGMGYLATYPSDFDWTLRDTGITVCHSHLFFFAGTTGVVGMVLYYGLLATGLWRLAAKARAVRTDPLRLGAVVGMTGAMVAGVLFTLTSTTFTALSYNLFLAVFLFCASIDWRRE